jgi:hypothetical protein
MLRFLIPYIPCGSLFVGIAIVALAFVVVSRLIGGWVISRPIPSSGFPSTEAEIRYVHDEPAIMRRHWKYKSWLIFGGVASLCLPLSYFVPSLILKAVSK